MTPEPQTALYRLMSWLSPSFPVGAYSYSHGIEYAFEAGYVTDPASLQIWIEGILEFGAGQTDGVLCRAAWQGVTDHDEALLHWAMETAAVLRASTEMALENTAQGTAFLETLINAWPDPGLEAFARAHGDRGGGAPCPVSYPVAVGAAAALSGIGRDATLTAYLHAFVGNLVSAGVRMIPLGQTAGQRITAALEGAVTTTAADLSRTPLDALRADIGSAAVMVDWSSMKHETQYTRIFRS